MLKRTLDICCSAAALVALSPLLAVIAAAVWIDSGRPLLFSQVRVGRAFRRFRIWKFRTMANGGGGPLVTAAGDRRITRVGRLLRRTKLDELAQFWNVLVGDMSLVGPRPEVPLYVEMFRERYEVILTVRPGITDSASLLFRDEEKILAQSGNAAEFYAERVLPLKLDLAEAYIRTQSFGEDLAVLVRTAGAITGLYHPVPPRLMWE